MLNAWLAANAKTQSGADHAVGHVLVVGPAVADPQAIILNHNAGDVGAQELVHQGFGVAASFGRRIRAAVVAHDDAAAFDLNLVASQCPRLSTFESARDRLLLRPYGGGGQQQCQPEKPQDQRLSA